MPDPGCFASLPCLAAEIAPGFFGPLATDPEQARAVARWRRAERIRLLAARGAISVTDRQAFSAVLAGHLRQFLAETLGGGRRRPPAYWPIKGEPDLRSLMAELHGAGVIIALPVVEIRACPLVVRRWHPGMQMTRGGWDIPVPPLDAERLTPDV